MVTNQWSAAIGQLGKVASTTRMLSGIIRNATTAYNDLSKAYYGGAPKKNISRTYIINPPSSKYAGYSYPMSYRKKRKYNNYGKNKRYGRKPRSKKRVWLPVAYPTRSEIKYIYGNFNDQQIPYTVPGLLTYLQENFLGAADTPMNGVEQGVGTYKREKNKIALNKLHIKLRFSWNPSDSGNFPTPPRIRYAVVIDHFNAGQPFTESNIEKWLKTTGDGFQDGIPPVVNSTMFFRDEDQYTRYTVLKTGTYDFRAGSGIYSTASGDIEFNHRTYYTSCNINMNNLITTFIDSTKEFPSIVDNTVNLWIWSEDTQPTTNNLAASAIWKMSFYDA